MQLRKNIMSVGLVASLVIGGAALLDSPVSAASNKQKAKASTKSKRSIKQKNKQSNKNHTKQTGGNASASGGSGGLVQCFGPINGGGGKGKDWISVRLVTRYGTPSNTCTANGGGGGSAYGGDNKNSTYQGNKAGNSADHSQNGGDIAVANNGSH